MNPHDKEVPNLLKTMKYVFTGCLASLLLHFMQLGRIQSIADLNYNLYELNNLFNCAEQNICFAQNFKLSTICCNIV